MLDMHQCQFGWISRFDAFYGFPGNSIKPRHERYRGLGGTAGIGVARVIEDIWRDMR
jgi:hypothetical protein